MRRYELFIPLAKIPGGTAQQKGERVVNGRIHHYTKKKISDLADILSRMLKKEMADKYPDFVPFQEGEAVAMKIVFHYPTKTKKLWGKPKVTRPDYDNLVKLPNDLITRLGWWKDDSQVSCGFIKKRWTEPNKGGIEIVLKEDSYD